MSDPAAIRIIPIYSFNIEKKMEVTLTLDEVITYLNDICDDNLVFSIDKSDLDNVRI